jgi:hypothetical protein
MEFALTSCRQTGGVRFFVFNGIASDRTRTEFIVEVDTALIGKYSIALQDLPLLCRQFLEKQETSAGSKTLTYSETEMEHIAAERAEVQRAVQLRKANRKPPRNDQRPASPRTASDGSSWR